MDKAALADKYIEDGRGLISALEDEKIAIDAAMWFYSAESDDWKLIIATPIVGEIGPRESYRKIQSVLEKMPSLSISLMDISVLSPSSSLISTIRNAIGHSKDIVLKGTVLDGLLISNAYIYCVA
jgi:hypothetical protein